MKKFLLYLALMLCSVSAFATSIPLTPVAPSVVSSPGSSFGTLSPVLLVDGNESFAATGLNITIDISPTQTLYIYTSGFLSATTGAGVITGTFSTPTLYLYNNTIATLNAPFFGTVNGLPFTGTLIQTLSYSGGVYTIGQGTLTSIPPAVPEPGSLVYLGTGLVGIAAVFKRSSYSF